MDKLRILQVNTSDGNGGAAKIACELHRTYKERQHLAWLAVGEKTGDDTNIFCVSNGNCHNLWGRICLNIQRRWERNRGIEDFHFPGTFRLLSSLSKKVDIVHCHNLHGYYFDLRALPSLNSKVPIILTLHDAWLLSGHCAHSFNCERWRTGCADCPDLGIYPAIRRDATAYNWRRKRRIYARCKFYVATPSRWLMQRVKQSMLAQAVIEGRVIHNGVDLSIFHPAQKQKVRGELGIPQDTKMLLFAADNIHRNIYKDYHTLRSAVKLISERLPEENISFFVLGEEMPSERVGRLEARFVGYHKDPRTVARYYQAADVYIHASHADTFPNTILEALACGTPVVATAVGGIPEQIEDGKTGFLIREGDAKAMASKIEEIFSNDGLRQLLSIQSVRHARDNFDLTRQAEAYLNWYNKILGERNRCAVPH